MKLAVSPPTPETLFERIRILRDNVQQVIYGKSEVIDLAVTTLLARGHLLLEDVPGVGKTTLALALARSIDGQFRRIQFTNDTLPADILGISVFSRKKEEFTFVPGPIFSSVVLADEINRASPKTQSALLEAMTDRRISYENDVHNLPNPFFVVATQNPLEHHGTFPLPENQLDRFLVRTQMGYPDKDNERNILAKHVETRLVDELEPVVSVDDILEAQKAVESVAVDETLLDYIVAISNTTREHPRLELGVSPRGSLALKRASQARAYLEGRNFVLPDDIKRLAKPVLVHRLVPKNLAGGTGARRESKAVLTEILETIPVPV